MNVFVSWSGTKSREVAVALREWLPGVINSVEPFVSSKDIDSGTRWQMEVAAQLEATAYGIVCVTRENQEAPWLNFEAGALAKVVESAKVVPLAIDLTPSDIKVPLGQFQAQPATEAGLHEIVTSLNAACPAPLSEELVEKAFKKWWPDLSRELAEIEARSAPETAKTPERSVRELLEEVLSTVRSLAQERSKAEQPPDDRSTPYVTSLVLAELRGLLPSDAEVLWSPGSDKWLGVRLPEDLALSSEAEESIRRVARGRNFDVQFSRRETRTPQKSSREADDT